MLAQHPPAPLDILIKQGSTFSLTLTLLDENDAARDLSSHEGRAEIRKTPSDAVAQAITVAFPGSGQITLTISAADTRALDFGNQPFLYDLVISDDSFVTTEPVVSGTAVLDNQITDTTP